MVSLFMVGSTGPSHVGVVSHAQAAEITGSFYGRLAGWEVRDPESQQVLGTFPDGWLAAKWSSGRCDVYQTFDAIVDLLGGHEECRRLYVTAGLVLNSAFVRGLITPKEYYAGLECAEMYNRRLWG